MTYSSIPQAPKASTVHAQAVAPKASAPHSESSGYPNEGSLQSEIGGYHSHSHFDKASPQSESSRYLSRFESASSTSGITKSFLPQKNLHGGYN
jgi:hypothetical protein